MTEHSIFLGNLAWDVTRELVMDMVNDVLGPGLFNQGNPFFSSTSSASPHIMKGIPPPSSPTTDAPSTRHVLQLVPQ